MSNGYKAVLNRFEKAVRADAWKGSQHPGDHATIERELDDARQALVQKFQYRHLAASAEKSRD